MCRDLVVFYLGICNSHVVNSSTADLLGSSRASQTGYIQ